MGSDGKACFTVKSSMLFQNQPIMDLVVQGSGYETIGERVRRRREELGKSKVELARLCGISKQAIGQIEAGDTKAPSGPTLISLSVALKVREEWLINGQGPKDRPEILGEDELILLSKYRRLNDRDKHTVHSVTDALIPPDKLPFTGTT